MPVPVVAIHLELPAQPPPLVEQLLGGCRAGRPANTCVLANDESAEEASYLAYVSWLDEGHEHALVEVGPRGEVRGSFEFRRLKFTEADQAEERWQAIGLTVATLAVPEPPAETADAPSPAPEPAIEDTIDRSWRVGVTTRVGSGFRDAGIAVGLGAGLAYRLPQLPLFAVAGITWRAAADQGFTGHWWEAAMGLGVEQELGSLRLSLAGMVMGQLLVVKGSRGDLEQSGTSSTPGLGGALELAWPSTGAVGATLGLYGVQLARHTEISAAKVVVLETPLTNFGASLGLEGRF